MHVLMYVCLRQVPDYYPMADNNAVVVKHRCVCMSAHYIFTHLHTDVSIYLTAYLPTSPSKSLSLSSSGGGEATRPSLPPPSSPLDRYVLRSARTRRYVSLGGRCASGM